MRLIALGPASAIATVLSFGVEAADYAYPPAAVGPPQYSVAPPAAVAPPQLRVAPEAPVPAPRYNGAPVPPTVIGSSPYGVAPPVAPPGAAPASPLPPRAACGPIWRCENGDCGWIARRIPIIIPAPPGPRRSTPRPRAPRSPTPAPTVRLVRRFTLAPGPCRLRRPTQAPTRQSLAPTRHKSIPVDRAVCAG